ncbi:prepilin-type N-terminal cleavage/methylation domain-containing protein [Synechococcus sp. MU1617]|uniref:prepilin-type N-terminal cleavage/methylation domain-containing protein n=1 Tax=Synechococcus sp. MU1617 TaxID=2508346 RepID=UPI001CF8C361|nr:prepilin-type N-terminal cleavage/methylation domain-containing protein [Synechococcus sp. MU1617]MCB4389096.1 prepilin-type N-terminal cleavage/methylation domain-containing protein [Synechococcus sp. MU1617]
MSLLQAYLRNPKTQRVLSRKPGDKGFSLIELVVVVAVLAILAAIAVPAFMGMNEQAADAAMDANLKNAYKECAFQIARQANNRGLAYPNFDFPGDDGFYTYTSNSINQAQTHNCYSSAAGAATTLTATKANATAGYNGNGAYTIDVLIGTRANP